jgi:HK97 family phage prohead protease
MDPERLNLPIEWKAAGDGSGEVEGHAAVFGNVDLQGDLILKGAFKKTLADWGRAKGNIPLVDGHLSDSAKTLLGSVKQAREDTTGLWFRAGFASDETSQAVRTKALEGHLTGVSIGWLPTKNGVAFKRGGDGEIVRVLSEVRLFEISLTPIPANPQAQLTSVKSASDPASPPQDGLDFDQFAEAMTKALALPTAASKAAVGILLADYHHEAAGAADGPPTADADATTDPPPAGDDAPPPDGAAAYALRLITPPGPRDGAPDGEPPQALAYPQQLLAAASQQADLDRLEAEITNALGRATA